MASTFSKVPDKLPCAPPAASCGLITCLRQHLLGSMELYLSSAGFCVAYLIFIGQNLTTLTSKDPAFFILGAGPILVALAMLRGVHALAPFSLIADAANICGALQLLACLLFGTHTCQSCPELGLANSLCFCTSGQLMGLHIQRPSARLLSLSPSCVCLAWPATKESQPTGHAEAPG